MTYEYTCTQCHHEWEMQQKISEAPETKCPACGKYSAKRLISGGFKRNAIFKAAGFYKTGGY